MNDLDLSCALPQTEIEGSRPSEGPLIDGVTICAEIPIDDKGVDMATNMSKTTISEDSLSSPMDTTSCSVLESSSMSDPLNASSSTAELTSPLDIISGLHQDLEHTSPVDIDNGLPEEPQPSDTPECLNGLHQDSLDSLMEHSGTPQQCSEEQCVDQITDDSTSAEDAADGHQDSSVDIANSEAVSVPWLLSSTCHPVNKSLTCRPLGMIHSAFACSHPEFLVARKVVVSRKAPLSRK